MVSSYSRDHPDCAPPAMPLNPFFLRRQLLLGATSALALAAGCSRSAKPKIHMLPKEATLLCLGDSLTFGAGSSPGNSYPQLLEKLIGHVTQNGGINGDRSDAALARLPPLLQKNQPGLVLVSIGINDFLQHMPPEVTSENLRQIVKTAKAVAQVALIAQPLPDPLATAGSPMKDHPLYDDIAMETGVPLFAGGWSHVLARSALRSDPIHPNDEGYKVFTERLAVWLRDIKLVA